MKATIDQTWRNNLKAGKVIEVFEIKNYRILFLKVNEQSSFVHYLYRLLVLPAEMEETFLSLNLEVNPIAKTCCLGAHTKDGHYNLGFADITMSEKEFYIWAITTLPRFFKLSSELKDKLHIFYMVNYYSFYETSKNVDHAMEPILTFSQIFFALSHAYADFYKSINKKRGTFLYSLFKKIEYEDLLKEAKEINQKFHDFKIKIIDSKHLSKNPKTSKIYNALLENLNDVLIASEITMRKMEISVRQSKGIKELNRQEFTEIVKKELIALDKCQESGDILTHMYQSIHTT